MDYDDFIHRNTPPPEDDSADRLMAAVPLDCATIVLCAFAGLLLVAALVLIKYGPAIEAWWA